MKAGILAGLVAMALGTVMWPGPAHAESVQVVILQEDAILDSVPRGAEPTASAAATLARDLAQMGTQAVLGTDVLPDMAGMVRVSSAELLTHVAALPQGAPELAVVFSLYAAIQSNPYTQVLEVSARMDGRLVKVADGVLLAAHSAQGGPVPLDNPCDRECMMASTARMASKLADDLAVVLGQAIPKD